MAEHRIIQYPGELKSLIRGTILVSTAYLDAFRIASDPIRAAAYGPRLENCSTGYSLELDELPDLFPLEVIFEPTYAPRPIPEGK